MTRQADRPKKEKVPLKMTRQADRPKKWQNKSQEACATLRRLKNKTPRLHSSRYDMLCKFIVSLLLCIMVWYRNKLKIYSSLSQQYSNFSYLCNFEIIRFQGCKQYITCLCLLKVQLNMSLKSGVDNGLVLNWFCEIELWTILFEPGIHVHY